MDTIGPKRINTNKAKQIGVEVNEKGCIVCTSHVPNKDGYVRLFVGNNASPRMQFLHRIEWEKVNGKIPKGSELDHLCRNRNCCNVNHLQVLTNAEHRVKTNKERYAEREARVVTLLSEGMPSKQISDIVEVTVNTVNRIKRKSK